MKTRIDSLSVNQLHCLSSEAEESMALLGKIEALCSREWAPLQNAKWNGYAGGQGSNRTRICGGIVPTCTGKVSNRNCIFAHGMVYPSISELKVHTNAACFVEPYELRNFCAALGYGTCAPCERPSLRARACDVVGRCEVRAGHVRPLVRRRAHLSAGGPGPHGSTEYGSESERHCAMRSVAD